MTLQPFTAEQIPSEPPPVLVVLKFHSYAPQASYAWACERFRAAFADAGKPCPPFLVLPPDMDVQFAAVPDLVAQLEAAGFVRADPPTVVGGKEP